MHYCINVFAEPGESLDEIMAPWEEGLDPEGETLRAWDYGQSGKWDYWVNGGRYDGYWNDTLNVVRVADILFGEAVPRFEVPYGFLALPREGVNPKYRQLSRDWFDKEIYVPGGFYEERPEFGGGTKWGISHFLPAPNFEKHYNDYLKQVPADTLVYVVDIHS